VPEISDPRTLRAIAHPVRLRILDELDLTGPLRAADIAAALDVPANQASFHLRQLAKYGLIEEAPEAARDGRDRVWKKVGDAEMRVDLSELEKQPGGKAAVGVFRQQWLASAHESLDRSMLWSGRKDSTVAVSSGVLRLTKAEARKLSEEMTALVVRYREAGTSGPQSAKTYEVLTVIQPTEKPLG
jgi:DNA-binding transcriptional ArsR family regulator